MTNPSIQEIVDELIALDPDLAAQGPKLHALVAHLLESRPTPPLTQEFVRRLRQQVLAAAAQVTPVQRRPSLITFLTMPKLSYVVAGAILSALIILPVVFSTLGRGVMPRGGILAVRDQAFGSLADSALAPRQPAASGDAAAPMLLARPQAGGGGGQPERAMAIASGAGVAASGVAVVEPMMIVPESYPTYRYVYRGEPVTLDSDSRAVLRRVKGTPGTAADLLRRTDLGSLDLSAFGGLRVQSLNLIPDRADGFAVFLDLVEGTASLNQYQSPAVGEPDRPYQPLAATDLPADADLIALANRFLVDHRISVAGYGTPVVQREGGYHTLAAEARGGASLPSPTVVVPDFVSVIYPQQHEGTTVVDEGGNPVGITVSINLRTRQVTGAWNLKTLRYESSQYPAETDFQRVVDIAISRNTYSTDGAAKVVEVGLGTPMLTYATVWRYREGGSDELLVPALSFPVTPPESEPFFYPKAVVVPLISELLDQSGGVDSPGKPVPMLLPAVQVKPEQ